MYGTITREDSTSTIPVRATTNLPIIPPLALPPEFNLSSSLLVKWQINVQKRLNSKQQKLIMNLLKKKKKMPTN